MDYPDESHVGTIKDESLARKVEHSLDVIHQALAEFKYVILWSRAFDCCDLRGVNLAHETLG